MIYNDQVAKDSIAWSQKHMKMLEGHSYYGRGEGRVGNSECNVTYKLALSMINDNQIEGNGEFTSYNCTFPEDGDNGWAKFKVLITPESKIYKSHSDPDTFGSWINIDSVVVSNNNERYDLEIGSQKVETVCFAPAGFINIGEKKYRPLK